MAHLHVNTPGVLATINGVLAEHGVNIEGQLLGTHVEVGLALTDIGLSIQKMSSPSCMNCRRRSRCACCRECERLG